MKIIDIIIQICILILGSSAIYLVGRKDKYKKYGYIFGLLAQPLWIYTSFKNEQYGIFIMAFVYIYSWGNGVYNYWIKK